MSAHTPGPWILERGRIKPFSRDRIFSVIADLNDGSMVHGSDPSKYTIDEMNAAEDANRRLMAAAPDLLESLRWTIQIIEDLVIDGVDCFSEERLADARAAICKAAA